MTELKDKQTNNEHQYLIRDSGIELLKIFAIVIIVISHVTETLTNIDPEIGYSDYIIKANLASNNLINFLLAVFIHFGVLGNTIFFVCSAWFLLKIESYNKKKWFFMLSEIWTISMIILMIAYPLKHSDISGKNIIRSIFPTLFGNNWYMTCYLLFYPISPLLNRIINSMSKKELLRCTLALSVLYIFLYALKEDLFFASPIILWIALYFVIALMQKYMMHFADNIRFNTVMLILNAALLILLIAVTDLLGTQISYFQDKVLHWANSNILVIVMSIAAFNIARNIHFQSRVINYISSLSLLIYIIHENIILRTYFRPALWESVYHNYGYQYVIGWVFIISLGVLLFSLLMSAIYSATFMKLVNTASEKIFNKLRNKFLKIEEVILNKL